MQSQVKFFNRLSNFFCVNKSIILILILALTLRIVFCLLVFPYLVEKEGEKLGWVIDGKLAADPYDSIAKNILAGKGYVDSTNQINFERLPVYTYFLVIVYKLFGFGLWKLQIVQSVLDTISCLFIYFISLTIFRDKISALLAAFLYSVYFKMINMVSRPYTETLYVLLLLLFIFIFLISIQKTGFAFLAGLSLGVLTLTKPVTLLFPLVVAGLYFFKAKSQRLRKTLLFLSGFIILILPLFIRNYAMEGKVFFSTGGGKMLYMGTVFDYTRDFRGEEQRLMEEINRNYSFVYRVEEDNKLREMAIDNIINDFWGYIKKVGHRLYLFWSYPDYSTRMMALKTVSILVFNIILILFSVLGFYFSKKKGMPFLLFLWIIVYYYSIYVIIYSNSRYSLPLFPILFMFSAFGIVSFAKKLELFSRLSYMLRKDRI